MKKKLIGILLAATIIIGCTGCSSTSYITNDSTDENVGGQLGNFIILEDTGHYNDEWGTCHHQYLVYDKVTYVIYIYDIENAYYRSGVSISPYYCLNGDNEPVVAVYYDGMEE